MYKMRCVPCNQIFTGKSNDTIRTEILEHIASNHKIGEISHKTEISERITFLYQINIECLYCCCVFISPKTDMESFGFFFDTHCCDTMKSEELDRQEELLEKEEREEIKRNYCGYGNDI